MIMLFMVAIGFLGPLLAPLCVSVIGGLGSRFNVTGRLAFDNARSNSRRLASVITPIALAVAFGATLSFMSAAEDHDASQQSKAAITADRVITGPGFTPRTTADLARVPGVESVTSVLNTSVVLARDGMLTAQSAQGVAGTTRDLDRVLDLDVREGTTTALRPGAPQPPGGAVALDRQTALALHADIGEDVSMWLGDGTAIKPVVVAVYARGLGTATVTLPRAAIAGHVDAALDPLLLVRFADGADTAAVDTELTELTTHHPGADVADRSAFAVRVDTEREANMWMNHVMIAILAGFATIAAVNTMAVTTAARGREMALMRMVGGTRSQVRSVLRREAILVGVIGLGLGLAVAYATLVPFTRGSFGTTTPYVPIPPALAIAAGALMVAPLTVAPVTRRLLRAAPIDAVGGRQ